MVMHFHKVSGFIQQTWLLKALKRVTFYIIIQKLKNAYIQEMV